MPPKKPPTYVYCFRLEPDSKLKLQLVALAKGISVSQQLTEIINNLWEQEKDSTITRVPPEIRQDTVRIFRKLYKSSQ